ncbi:1,2-dihydroxy-3-keto-5-methylthiopentene dioxygenase [Butyriboletus roseoflavus]|nr:1,2-dihydroxy-3-keto-5-methylthiopentene dioxygenase [Butyriboletus roseoflavus]
MRAYYFDNIPGDQRLPHDSGTPVDDAVLASIGVLHWHIPIDTGTSDCPEIAAVARERGYKNRDVITITKEGLGDLYETKLKHFYEEHMHEDEEIRYILEGSGFFDVRGKPTSTTVTCFLPCTRRWVVRVEHLATDKWIRCALDAGDLLVLPAGIYHRFTLDERNMVKAMRLFQASSPSI